jgi:hypothetical protein
MSRCSRLVGRPRPRSRTIIPGTSADSGFGGDLSRYSERAAGAGPRRSLRPVTTRIRSSSPRRSVTSSPRRSSFDDFTEVPGDLDVAGAASLRRQAPRLEAAGRPQPLVDAQRVQRAQVGVDRRRVRGGRLLAICLVRHAGPGCDNAPALASAPASRARRSASAWTWAGSGAGLRPRPAAARVAAAQLVLEVPPQRRAAAAQHVRAERPGRGVPGLALGAVVGAGGRGEHGVEAPAVLDQALVDERERVVGEPATDGLGAEVGLQHQAGEAADVLEVGGEHVDQGVGAHAGDDHGGDLARAQRREALAEPKLDALAEGVAREGEASAGERPRGAVTGQGVGDVAGEHQGARQQRVVGADVGDGEARWNELGDRREAWAQSQHLGARRHSTRARSSPGPRP